MSLFGMIGGLLEAKVRFVVVGGVAARAHGSTRVTEDLDICYDPSRDNVSSLVGLLADWDAYPRGVEPGLPFILDERTFTTTPIMTLKTSQGALDLQDKIPGVGGYEQALTSSGGSDGGRPQIQGSGVGCIDRVKTCSWAASRP